MHQHGDPGWEALERLALEGYRSEALTHYQASQLLGMARFEFESVLNDRGIYVCKAMKSETSIQRWSFQPTISTKVCLVS